MRSGTAYCPACRLPRQPSLSVPVIAALGGIVLLGEAVSLRFLIASALVLGGITLSLVPRRKTR